MKKIAYILLPILAGFTLTGCDNMLDVYPLDRMSPETFYKTETELQAYGMNLYAMLPGGASLFIEDADTYIQMGLTDEQKGTRTVPASGGGWSWGNLRTANTMLEYLPNCSDPAVRAKYEGFARFFRAYFYFNMVKRFGDVPWYDKPVGSADTEALNRPRDSRTHRGSSQSLSFFCHTNIAPISACSLTSLSGSDNRYSFADSLRCSPEPVFRLQFQKYPAGHAVSGNLCIQSARAHYSTVRRTLPPVLCEIII